MDGLGNDFLIIDNRKQKVYLNEKQIQKLSNRENGIGFDQLIYIEKEGADLRDKNTLTQMENLQTHAVTVTDVLLKF